MGVLLSSWLGLFRPPTPCGWILPEKWMPACAGTTGTMRDGSISTAVSKSKKTGSTGRQEAHPFLALQGQCFSLSLYWLPGSGPGVRNASMTFLVSRDTAFWKLPQGSALPQAIEPVEKTAPLPGVEK
jgi:hypothetical protein